MSVHHRQNFNDIIGAGPTVGFLPKLSLSAEAIRALVSLGAVDVFSSP
jgi:hypothetical protein